MATRVTVDIAAARARLLQLVCDPVRILKIRAISPNSSDSDSGGDNRGNGDNGEGKERPGFSAADGGEGKGGGGGGGGGYGGGGGEDAPREIRTLLLPRPPPGGYGTEAAFVRSVYANGALVALDIGGSVGGLKPSAFASTTSSISYPMINDIGVANPDLVRLEYETDRSGAIVRVTPIWIDDARPPDPVLAPTIRADPRALGHVAGCAASRDDNAVRNVIIGVIVAVCIGSLCFGVARLRAHK